MPNGEKSLRGRVYHVCVGIISAFLYVVNLGADNVIVFVKR